MSHSKSRVVAGVALALLAGSATGGPVSAAENSPLQYVSKADPTNCLAVSGASVTIEPCATKPAQLWTRIDIINTVQQLRNDETKTCLSLVRGLGLRNCSADTIQTTGLSIVKRDNEVQIFSLQVPINQCLGSAFTSKPIFQACSTADSRPPDDQLWTPKRTVKTDGTHATIQSLSLPFVGVASAHTNTGDVLLWAGSFEGKPGGYADRQSTLFTTFRWKDQTVDSESKFETVQFYAAGHALDKAGRLVVAGGLAFTAKSASWDGRKFGFLPDMAEAVRNNTLVTLANGNILSMGGGHPTRPVLHRSPTVFDGKQWTALNGIRPVKIPDIQNNYPVTLRRLNDMWVFASNDGRYAFQAGPSKAMHWIDLSGSGSVAKAGERGEDAIGGSAVMYAQGKILVTGGSTNGVRNARAFNNAYTVEIEDNKHVRRPAVKVTAQTDDLKQARTYHNSVVLPNGEVLIVGGASTAGFLYDATAVRTAEIWNPETKKFRTLDATLPKARTAGSTAILLPDGKVLIAGGAYCTMTGCPRGSFTATNGEILSPPYLFAADKTPAPRPVIVKAPDQIKAGGKFSVTVSGTSTPFFSLVRMSSTSAGVNSDQRFLKIPLVESVTDGIFDMTAPTVAQGLIPGKYMLFALCDCGTPSIAKIVQID